MALLQVDKDTCSQCGTCAAVCPGGIILFRENRYPRMLPGTDEYCLRCGHCVAACPTGSLIHRDIPLEQCLPIDKENRVSPEQCEQLIRGRRSVRVYQDKAVPREEIARIIDAARYAPTGHNSQNVRWLVIDDKAKLQRIEEIGADWMRDSIKRHPQMAEMFEGVLKRMESGHPDFIRGAPALVAAYAEKNNPMAIIDGTIALSYFDLLANSMGLGCCWAGFFMMASANFPPLIEAIALPEGHQVYGSLMVGYPKYQYQRVPMRNPADIIWK
jgi:nitroreductase/NAD-dependent dihydropyrimidine dehydrogenase PreA subunit